MKSIHLFCAAVLCMFVVGAKAEDSLAFQRAFPIERAIRQADEAIGYPGGRPESLELLRVVYVVEPLKDDRFDGIVLPDQVVRQLAGKTFWLLQYRPYPVQSGGVYAVFLNGLTGETVHVARIK